jgi:hypothetical protein
MKGSFAARSASSSSSITAVRSPIRARGQLATVRKRIILVALAILFAIALPSVSLGGQIWTMHPAGRGPQSYASWRANVGEPDSGGTGNQAIYMQKMNTTGDKGMGVVVLRGLAGQPVSALQELSWERPAFPAKGSYCGASPHWQLSVTSGGTTSTVAFGPCFAAVHSAGATAGWMKDTCDSGCLGGLPSGTINSLAIIFEDGTDLGPGFVLLDNITVNSGIGSHTWTSSSANATASITIGATLALADVVTDVLGDLLNLFPDVPSTEWTLYPGVEILPLPGPGVSL